MPRRTLARPRSAHDISGLASVLADPSRARMLDVLLDGEAHPIGALARRVRISAATASTHLRRLDEAGLVAIEVVGRERRVALAGADVAGLLEQIGNLARARVPRATAIDELRFARTCYDHLAGLLGVAIVHRLVDLGWLYRTSDNLEPATPLLAWLAARGQPVRDEARRPLSRACLDWTEREPHLAGRVGAALATVVVGQGWVRRVRASRALRLTDRGRRALVDELGLVL